jgi:hypothetical protein
MKILRENPRTSESAVEIAMKEQNLRKRFTLRSTETTRPNELLQETRFDTSPHFLARNFNQDQAMFRNEEQMEIDHYRGIQCKANKCPNNQTPQKRQHYKNFGSPR